MRSVRDQFPQGLVLISTPENCSPQRPLMSLSLRSIFQTICLYQTDMAGACSPGHSNIPSGSLARLEHPPGPCVTHQAVRSCPDSTLAQTLPASRKAGRSFPSPGSGRDPDRGPACPPLHYLPSESPAGSLSQQSTASHLLTKLLQVCREHGHDWGSFYEHLWVP